MLAAPHPELATTQTLPEVNPGSAFVTTVAVPCPETKVKPDGRVHVKEPTPGKVGTENETFEPAQTIPEDVITVGAVAGDRCMTVVNENLEAP